MTSFPSGGWSWAGVRRKSTGWDLPNLGIFRRETKKREGSETSGAELDTSWEESELGNA